MRYKLTMIAFYFLSAVAAAGYFLLILEALDYGSPFAS